MKKYCGGCKTVKLEEEFGKDKHRTSGLTSQCKVCRNVRCSKYRKDHPEFIAHLNKMNTERRKTYYADPERKRKYKSLELKRTYGITLEQYELLFNRQNGLCAICNKPELGTRNDYLAVDHDHTTNEIRGLLCNFCNRAIGLFCDDIVVIEQAVEYLKEYKNASSSNPT